MGDTDRYRGRRVVIVGGGDAAVDWALSLAGVADRITLVHRRDRFRAHEGSVRRLEASPVRVARSFEVAAIAGGERVEAVILRDRGTGREERIAADEVLISIGMSCALGPVRDWGLTVDRHGIVVNSRMETNVPGVYAAGDVASYPGKLKLIATAFGEAAVAVNHAKAFIDPASSSFPGHSSDLVPKRKETGIEARKIDVADEA